MRKLMGEQMKQRQGITKSCLDKLPEAERKAMQKDLDARRETTHQSMRALLKPEQQQAFDEGMKKMEEKRAERAEFLEWKAERDQKN
jgi:TRAP-type C4-dicarboxylate transport system substrate-binding protein